MREQKSPGTALSWVLMYCKQRPLALPSIAVLRAGLSGRWHATQMTHEVCQKACAHADLQVFPEGHHNDTWEKGGEEWLWLHR